MHKVTNKFYLKFMNSKHRPCYKKTTETRVEKSAIIATLKIQINGLTIRPTNQYFFKFNFQLYVL